MNIKLTSALALGSLLAPLFAHAAVVDPTTALLQRVNGRILLQVESRGEAWYVNPADHTRYYLKDGPTAYTVMRQLSLGISNANFARLEAGDAALRTRLAGRIVLKVEDLGKAYYVHPTNGTLIYLQNGAAAFSLMSSLGVGIRNSDLALLASRALPPTHVAIYEWVPPVNENAPRPPSGTGTPPLLGGTDESDDDDNNQRGDVPSGISISGLNALWAAKVNEFRGQRALSPLQFDQRLANTSSEYAGIAAANNFANHQRLDGMTTANWLKQRGIPVGYGGENVTSFVIDNTSMDSQEDLINGAFQHFVNQFATNDVQYQNLLSNLWTSVGAGFYFEPLSDGRYKVTVVSHFAKM